MTDLAANRELLRLQIEELWGRGRTELVDHLYTDDVVDHMPLPGQARGLAGLRDTVAAFHAGLPDLKITVHAILAEADRAVDVWTLEATHSGPLMGIAPTGRTVRFSGIDMVRIRDGRISDIWHVEELLQFVEQLRGNGSDFGKPMEGRHG